MEWFENNLGTMAAIAILSTVVAAIILKLLRDRKHGKSSCGCGCSNCAAKASESHECCGRLINK